MVKTLTAMRYLQPGLLISWLILSVNIALSGQDTPQITDLRLSFGNNQLEIQYNLIGGNPSDAFRVWVEITDSSGIRIDAKSLTGDVGLSVTRGLNKKILWNLSEDGMSISQEIFVEVKAERQSGTEVTKGKVYRSKSGYGKLFIKSTVLPGWGLTEIKRGKPFWIVGVSGYTCLVTSFVFHQKALDTKNEYENALDISIEKNDELYNKAASQHRVSNALAYTFIALWITDKVILTVTKNKSVRSPVANNSGIGFSADYDPYFQNQVFKIYYNF